MQKVGFSFRAVRIFVAFLDVLPPFLLLRYARKQNDTATTEHAALLLAVSSLMNVLGTAALAEVPFTLAILFAATLLDEERPVRAGIALTIAATMRYEAWFATAVMGLFWIAQAIRTKKLHRDLLITAAIPSTVIVLYIVYRRFLTVTDHGEWLWFVRETYRFTHMQRGIETGHSRIFEYLWFPVILPLLLLGPAVALVLFNNRWRRPSTILPLALILFLALTYLGRGALGQERYLTVLMPFACLAIARSRLQKIPRLASTLSVLGASLVFVFMTARSASRRADDLRAREDRANAICAIALNGPGKANNPP